MVRFAPVVYKKADSEICYWSIILMSSVTLIFSHTMAGPLPLTYGIGMHPSLPFHIHHP